MKPLLTSKDCICSPVDVSQTSTGAFSEGIRSEVASSEKSGENA